MDRREFLAGVAATGVAATAGCINTGGGNSEEEAASTREERRSNARLAGERVVANNIAVTIHELVMAESWKLEGEEENLPPTAGGHWALCRIEVEQVGEKRLDYPVPQDDITFPYHEEDEAEQFFPEEQIIVREEYYDSYHATLTERNIYERGAFPGVIVDAWLLFEIPREYIVEDLMCSVTWGKEENEGTASWVFEEEHITQVPE